MDPPMAKPVSARQAETPILRKISPESVSFQSAATTIGGRGQDGGRQFAEARGDFPAGDENGRENPAGAVSGHALQGTHDATFRAKPPWVPTRIRWRMPRLKPDSRPRPKAGNSSSATR